MTASKGHAEIRPIFLFSLQRSGSTLAQRLLASHPAIATASEPWLLLPYVYILRTKGVNAEYDHRLASTAIRHFVDALPGGLEDYRQELRRHILRLYEKAAGGSKRYFLDKSPRYSLVAADIMEMFPNAKCIFLWRSPLAYVASMIELFGGNRAHILFYPTTGTDLYRGLAGLLGAYERNRDRALSVRYEDLVTEPERVSRDLFRFLELDYDPSILTRFQALRFHMGDPLGTAKYSVVSSESLDKWKHILNNPYRKWWCRRYLSWIGSQRLTLMGYSLSELRAELDALPFSTHRLVVDSALLLYALVKLNLFPRFKPGALGKMAVLRPPT